MTHSADSKKTQLLSEIKSFCEEHGLNMDTVTTPLSLLDVTTFAEWEKNYYWGEYCTLYEEVYDEKARGFDIEETTTEMFIASIANLHNVEKRREESIIERKPENRMAALKERNEQNATPNNPFGALKGAF